jgi:hypothetical protein
MFGFPDLTPKQACLSIPPPSPHQALDRPSKGAVSGHFKARFIPNPAKQGSIFDFPKTIVLFFVD